MITLNEINIKYRSDFTEMDEQEWDGERAVLPCAANWGKAFVEAWLPGFDFDAIESIKDWLTSRDVSEYNCHLEIFI